GEPLAGRGVGVELRAAAADQGAAAAGGGVDAAELVVEGVGDVDHPVAGGQAERVLELGGGAGPVMVAEAEEVARPADGAYPWAAVQIGDGPDAGGLGVGDVEDAVHEGQAARLGGPGLAGVAV